MYYVEKDGTTKMHLSSPAISVKSPREIIKFIKTECANGKSILVCVCVWVLTTI